MQQLAEYAAEVRNPLRLSTEQFDIYPYARHVQYPPDTLYVLYRAMRDEKTLDRVFYEGEEPDLVTLCGYFDASVLFLAVAKDQQTLLGAVWFTHPVKGHKANIGIWYSRKAHGAMAREITDRVLRFAMPTFQWPQVWAFTPWRQAAEHGRKIGFKPVATLPKFIRHRRGRMMDMHVLVREE